MENKPQKKVESNTITKNIKEGVEKSNQRSLTFTRRKSEQHTMKIGLTFFLSKLNVLGFVGEKFQIDINALAESPSIVSITL